MTTDEIKTIEINNIFNDVTYIVPIYQRDYAWTSKQIEQLLEDIYSAQGDYYLGTLIVNQKKQNVYEIIDGQQRLTTLYLLKLYLLKYSEKDSTFINTEPLQFEAREKYSNTLLNIRNNIKQDDEFTAAELYEGYQNIEAYFSNKIQFINNFAEKLKHVYIVRVQVPKGIDLNHYFEIMNTRGEQLEPHQIVKARIFRKLSPKDRKTADTIWECCENMDSYIQMNFNPDARKKLFNEKWTDLNCAVTWDKLKECLSDNNDSGEDNPPTLKDILERYEYKKPNDNNNDTEEDERFESVITFPNFLLQVNAVISNGEDDASLDDNFFIEKLKANWENSDNAKEFVLKMLQCRVLFDKYILKREYAKEYRKTGKWSLKRLEKYHDSNGDKPNYISTYSKKDDEDDKKTQKLKTLESALRITYTSPKTMHWITKVLKTLLSNPEDKENLVELLENYCLEKIKESNYKNKNGFDIERIVFSYLDYLLYRDGYKNIIKPLGDWEFQFRNSIEHFYPQKSDTGKEWEKEDCDRFGNLALITVTGNSKFSNIPPDAKIKYEKIVDQSLKLKIMSDITNKENNWTQELAKNHEQEMIKILDENGVK